MTLVSLTLFGHSALAQSPAEAAPPPVSVAVLVSSRADVCFDTGDVGAITTLTHAEAERINRQGGIAGRRVELRILDDESDHKKTVSNLGSALADPNTVAIVGLSNSNRAKATFEAIGAQIKSSGVPFLSSISVNTIFKDYPNVLTTQPTQDEDRLPVMAQFIRRMGFARVAYDGLGDAVFSSALGDGLKRMMSDRPLVADQRMKSVGDALDPAEVSGAVAAIKAASPEMLVLGFGAERANTFLGTMVRAGVTPTLFLAGRIESLPPELVKTYPNAIYQLAWDRVPEAYNDWLQRVISSGAAESWVFEGRKIAAAPGWASGQCKPRPADNVPDPLDSANLRAIGIGARFADMVALVAETARAAKPGTSVAGLRRHIIQELTTAYAAGRGMFRGSFENWSSLPSTRSAVRTPFVVILPQGLGRMQLAPVQFVRTRDGGLREISTLYVDIDLVRAHRVDDNEKTFSAEFYLSMRDGTGASIEQIEFTNAFLDPRTNGRQLTIEMLHGGGENMSYPESMKIYKVSGRFTFEPELATYPFDTQRFAINLQPRRADQPFVIQPPPIELRDKQVGSDGWDLKSQYVGYSGGFVPLLNAYTHEPSVVPYYNASFVWLMKRQTTDYFLRVVVPLAFILIVAYLSYFITTAHFEAIVTIQVTALLSAVALYLSLPKLDSDAATLSDRLFVFNYMLVSLMIGISILRVNAFAVSWPWMRPVLRIAHVAGIPALIAAVAIYIARVTEV